MPSSGEDGPGSVAQLAELPPLTRRVAGLTPVVAVDAGRGFSPSRRGAALRDYRQASGVDARLVVVGMVRNGFTIADPSDPGMLDVVGFDTATPQLISDFVQGALPDREEHGDASTPACRPARAPAPGARGAVGEGDRPRRASQGAPRGGTTRAAAPAGCRVRPTSRPPDSCLRLVAEPHADVAKPGRRTGLRNRRPTAMGVRLPPSAPSRRAIAPGPKAHRRSRPGGAPAPER